jgi:Skp family chaperone for outer membrane proteins
VSRKYLAGGIVVLVIVLAALGYYFWGPAGDHTAVQVARPATQSAPQSSGPLPEEKIVVIDRGIILQRSKVGQDVTRQVQAFADQARKNLAAQRQELEDENAALQKQAAGLAPDARQKRIAALDAKQHAFQEAVQREDARIQEALQQANMAVAKAMAPILEQVVKEHHANLVLDKRAVIASSEAAFDITNEIISRLDDKLTSLTVKLPSSPAQ